MMAEGQELTPTEYVEVTNALSVSLRLLLLDKVWTREAQLASVADTRDPARVRELGAIIDEMDGLLRQCQEAAPPLAAIAERKGSLLQTRFDTLTEPANSRGISEERIADISGRLRHHVTDRAGGDAVRYLSQASELLQAGADTEIEQLRAELARVSADGGGDGDMSQATEEEVAAIALGAGLLLGPEAAGAVIIVAEVVDCLFG
jgi:hypothetical protein